MRDDRFDAVRAYQGWAMSPEDRARLPYYDHLLNALGASATACDLLASARATQRNPMLVLAALHYHALGGDEVLAPLYDAIGVIAPDLFASEVVARLEAAPWLVRDELHRSTQTNEPGRSAVLAAVLREVARRGVGDVHLIDVGTSMGLNLFPDQYRVNVDDPDDAAVLSVENLGDPRPDGPLPTIHDRVGIDLNPLDPDDPDDVRWLRACLWPEEPNRDARLRAILARRDAWPPSVRVRGAALDVIGDVVASRAPGAAPVIFHSWVAGYFTPDDQVAWRERAMAHVSRGGVWIYVEHPESVAGLAPPASPDPAPGPGSAQIVVALPGGEPTGWGWSHPHGRWMVLDPR